MRTPIEDLKNELRILEELSKQKHPDFLKYKNSIPVYEKAIKTLTEAETINKPALNMASVSKQRELLIAELVKTKALTEHLTQDERNEYFDLAISNL